MTAEEWFNKGVALTKESRFKEALLAFEQAIKINPKNANAWYNKGIVLAELDMHEEELQAYEMAIKINPQFAVAWNNKGISLGKFGRYEEELQAYEMAIKINPQFAVAWNNKGISLGEFGRYNEALQAFDNAIKINPKYAKAWNNKGVALIELDRHEKALQAFDNAIKINPKYAKAWYNKGVALGRLGRYEEALQVVENAIKINPKDTYAWVIKGIVLVELNRHNEALQAYESAIKINPKDTKAWYNKSELLYFLGAYKAANKMVNRVLAINKDSAEAHILKGKIEINAGNFEKAHSNLINAKSLEPQSISANFWIIYCKYLQLSQICPKDEKQKREDNPAYLKQMHLIILDLQQTMKAFKNKIRDMYGDNTMAEIYYWLGALYFKINDLISAKENLEESLELNTNCAKAKELLDHIWNARIRPSWWRWWFFSPEHLNRVIKQVAGGIITFLLGIEVIILFIHPFKELIFQGLNWQIGMNIININWQLYGLLAIILALLLLSPILLRFKAGGVEVELTPPTGLEFSITPAFMEYPIAKMEETMVAKD